MIIIRQKEFARRDYEGLDEISKANLRKERSELAKELNESRNRYNKYLNRKLGNLKTATGIVENDAASKILLQGQSFYNDIGAAHGGEVRQMVNQMMGGNDPEFLKKNIYRDRNTQYNEELRNIKADSYSSRKDELKRTKAREDAARIEREEAARRAAKSQESIARHEAKAAELRAKKQTGKMLKRGGIALATAGVLAAGYGAKKLYDRNKEKENQKSFSMREEDLKRRIASPSNLKNLPIPIQKYYQSGINKDLYRLAQLQGTVATDYVVGPIPCPGEFTKEKDGKTYKSIFGYSIDDIDLGKADIWYDENGDLYKMSGIFFRSFKQININELKDYLKKQIVEDDFVGEAYKGDKNYQQIVSLEKQIISKVDRI